MIGLLNSILNTLIRNVDYKVRIIISVAFFMVSVFSLMWSVRKKNDKNPIAWGWMILCVLSLCLSFLYIAL